MSEKDFQGASQQSEKEVQGFEKVTAKRLAYKIWENEEDHL